jgi:hypothetical protein
MLKFAMSQSSKPCYFGFIVVTLVILVSCQPLAGKPEPCAVLAVLNDSRLETLFSTSLPINSLSNWVVSEYGVWQSQINEDNYFDGAYGARWSSNSR